MTEEMREAIATIEDFLNGTDEPWAWDDLLSLRPRDPLVVPVQGFCRQLPADYPPTDRRDYCSEEGLRALRAYVTRLREQPPPPPDLP